ncbi:Protein kinase domain [Dillenia turbinata]|uniref:Receptor-like serine/threonine-protein kinase n=1 Tax=Dillenia turbinata TaxID=194707 RepID=A0AAN8ZPQ7_9MAGN
MGTSLFSLVIAATFFSSSIVLTVSGPLYVDSITTLNFTASNYQYIDNSGAFLASNNQIFKATITNPLTQLTNFYFSVIHAPSGTIVWSANRNKPISNSGKVRLTEESLSVIDDSGVIVWSTTQFRSNIASLKLSDDGNLVLLDGSNSSLWQSFENPTDTIILGQRLPVGSSLVSSVSNIDFSEGEYVFSVTSNDGLLRWNGLTYWKLSMEINASIDSYSPVSFLQINGTGLFLFGFNESVIVIHLAITPFNFSIAQLGSEGALTLKRFVGSNWVQDFAWPSSYCQIPFVCDKIGLCSARVCSCPLGFHKSTAGGCVPANSLLSLPSCNASDNGNQLNNSSISYLNLGNNVDYFSNAFMQPAKRGVNLSLCQELCTQNCSCLGLFHGNSSGNCYLLENYLGSVMSSSSGTDRLGYVKVLVKFSNENPNGTQSQNQSFPLVGLILIPPSAFLLLLTIVFLGIFWWRKHKLSRTGSAKLGGGDYSSGELELISFSGLPVRFEYEELAAATENFKTQIGFGGFGVVYKGTLPDKSLVAVKKINSIGVQGKKEFCTEIAIIGKIHHINLVRLKGFCAQGRQRFLVYEYMNKGSLDRSLFENGPVLEWQERFDIALGTARGLAYLHSGCEQKIIHCDVKPENILLHDNLQVKISDFGLSKLLSPEQSCLFTNLRGTRGYLAPEWLTSTAISDKTDVYSYGMVLLEIVRGRKNCSMPVQSHGLENDSTEGDDPSSSTSGLETRPVYFPLLALEMHEEGRYLELADPRLEGRVTSEKVEKLVRVALCCVHEEPAIRPTMSNVVGMLEGSVTVGQPRVESLNFLRFYGRRFTEASRHEGFGEANGNEFFSQRNSATFNSTAVDSHNSFSYMSSQQVSGPR